MDIMELLKSKKVKALVLGVIVTIGSQFGLDEASSATVAENTWKMVCAYLVAQGAADFGKGKLQAGEKIALAMDARSMKAEAPKTEAA